MPAPASDLGRTALVTGASSGIGRAFAVALARRGMDVVAVARRQDRLEALASELGPDAVEVLPADLSDREQLAVVERRASDPARPIDVLVNAAGFGTQGRFARMSMEVEDREIQLNVVALAHLTRAALGGMVERGRGAVVNVSSLAGHQPIPLWATYSATKAFVTTFSRALADEVRGNGVNVLLVLPGFTRTEFHDQSGFERKLIPGPAWMSADAVAEWAVRDLERGRTESVPGLHNRATAVATRLSPWPVTRRVLRFAMRRMW